MLHFARVSLVMILVLTIQTTWMVDLRPFGVVGDLLLLVAISAGLAGGAERGAMVGFAAGILMDLVAWTPLGLSALVYLAIGYAVGTLHEGVIRSAPWIPIAATFVASAAGIMLYVLTGQLIGQEYRLQHPWTVGIVASVINTFLAYPMFLAMRWCEKAARPVAAFKVR